MELSGEILLPGSAEAPLLRFDRPISFWGGVDPLSGRVTDPRHPQHGVSVAGRILALPGTIGSSSSSAILLELIAQGRGPAGLLLVQVDAILLLGGIVAGEIGYRPPPALRLSPAELLRLPDGAPARLTGDGRLLVADAGDGS